MKLFTKIVNGYQPLTIFTKSIILDVRLSNEYASKEDEQSAMECVDNDSTIDDALTKNIKKELGAYHMGKFNLAKRSGSAWRNITCIKNLF